MLHQIFSLNILCYKSTGPTNLDVLHIQAQLLTSEGHYDCNCVSSSYALQCSNQKTSSAKHVDI